MRYESSQFTWFFILLLVPLICQKWISLNGIALNWNVATTYKANCWQSNIMKFTRHLLARAAAIDTQVCFCRRAIELWIMILHIHWNSICFDWNTCSNSESFEHIFKFSYFYGAVLNQKVVVNLLKLRYSILFWKTKSQ